MSSKTNKSRCAFAVPRYCQKMSRIILKKDRNISSKLLDYIFCSSYLDGSSTSSEDQLYHNEASKSACCFDVHHKKCIKTPCCKKMKGLCRRKTKISCVQEYVCSNCKKYRRRYSNTCRKHKIKDNYEMSNHSSRSFESDSSSDSEKVQQKRKHSCSSERDFSARKMIRRQCSHSRSWSKDCEIVKEVQPEHLYGLYHCQVCNLSLNSTATYNSHIVGKNHQKVLNARNAFGVDTKAFVRTQVGSKCPEPPPGYYRKKLHCPAKIQPYVDENLNSPCPGLANVIEIQGVTETSYYCSVCNSHCNNDSILPHLNGFKHQLSCLKYFNCNMYERLSYKQKYQIEEEVAQELRYLERKYGRGLIKVKRDVPVTDSHNAEIETACSDDDMLEPKSTSRQVSGSDFSYYFEKYNTPDPSKPGYYCKLCDSHSNNSMMWQSHIVGKRHLSNVKKAPGTAPSKCKYVCAPMARSYLLDKLDEVCLPVVGLNAIREIRKPKINGVMYNCFLCCACISELEIVDHILSRKHREKSLENIKHPDFKLLKGLIMSETARESIIQDICAKVEIDEGRGTPEVYYAKNAIRRS